MTVLTLTKEAHVVHSVAGLPVDGNTRPELVDFGAKLLRSENSRQTIRGSVIKRNGFAAMPTSRYSQQSGTFSNAAAGYKLLADRQSMLRITDTGQAEVFSPTEQVWTQAGLVPEVGVSINGVASVMTATTLPPEDIEYVNGFIAVQTKATTNGGTDGSLQIIDATTKASVGGASIGYGRTLLASFSGRYLAVVKDQTTQIQLTIFDTGAVPVVGIASYTVSSAGVSANGYAGGDLAVWSLSDRVAVAYVNNSGGTNNVSVFTFNQSGQLDNVTINTSSAVPNFVDVRAYPGGTLWVAWNETTLVNMIGLTSTSLSTVLATKGTIITVSTSAAFIGISPDSTTTGRLFVNAAGAGISTNAYTNGFRTSGGVATATGSSINIHNTIACSRPLLFNGRHYVLATGGAQGIASNTQQVVILVDWTNPIQYVRPVANLAPNLAVNGKLGKLKITPGAVSTTFYTSIGITRSSTAVGAQLVTLDFADTRRWQVAAFGGSTYLSSGLLAYFDGTRVAESGFVIRPRLPSVALSGTGYTGTVRYVAVYEEVDANGNWHVSGVSDPSSSITAANQGFQVSISPLTITSRIQQQLNTALPNVRIALYRTLTGGSPPYYRIGTLANDVTVDAVVFTDAAADTTVAAFAQLYEQPGLVGTAQDRRAPPNFQALTAYNGMLVGASDSDLWYSGQNVSGEGVWFNPVFQVPIPGDGPITGLAALDGTLFVFKRRDIYAIAGDPPSDNGSSGGLGTPRRIAADVGCIEPRSTCTTSLGIFFQSDRGIEILTRAQSVEWIGEPYQNTIAANPVCTSITVEPVSNTVLVELAQSQSGGVVSGTGCTLVYDLSMKQWVSKDLRLSGTPSQSACIVPTSAGPRYGWITSAGQVYTETPGTSLDAGAWITTLIETANARHGLQQRQRVWNAMVLYARPDAAGLKIEIAYDYAGYTETKTWTETETLGSVQLETRPKSEHAAIRFRISDTAPAVLGTGQGLTFIGLSIDMAPKQGPTKGTPQLNPALRK